MRLSRQRVHSEQRQACMICGTTAGSRLPTVAQIFVSCAEFGPPLGRAPLLRPTPLLLGRESHGSPPSRAEVKNAWSYACTSPHTFISYCLFKYRDSTILILRPDDVYYHLKNSTIRIRFIACHFSQLLSSNKHSTSNGNITYLLTYSMEQGPS